MIVEDHPFQHLYLQNRSSELGDFDLACARDGEEALACLKQRDFDLVLTDLLMPGMDGRAIYPGPGRAQPSRLALVIMQRRLTAHADGRSPAASNLQVKVIGLISKPVNAAALRCLTDQLLALRVRLYRQKAQPGIDRQSLTNALVNGELQAGFQPKKAREQWSHRCGRSVSALGSPRALACYCRACLLPALIACHLEERLLWRVFKEAMAAQALWRQQG